MDNFIDAHKVDDFILGGWNIVKSTKWMSSSLSPQNGQIYY